MRGQGYDPLVPPDDPRVRGRASWTTSRACACPMTMTRCALSGKRGGSNSCVTGPCSRPIARRTRESARTVKTAIDWLERRAGDPDPFMLWLDLFSPHGPWDPPQPFRDQYVTVEPDEFEAGEEGDLVETASEDDDDEIDIEDVAVLIDVPAGRGGRRAQRGRAVPPAADVRRDRDARSTAGWASCSRRCAGWAGWTTHSLVFTSDQGEPLGEHGFVRRFRPWLYEELIHTPLIVRMPRGQFGGSGTRLSFRRSTCCRPSSRPWVCADRARQRPPCTATTCSP